MKKIPTAEEFFSNNNGLYTAYSVKDKEGKFQSVCSYEKAIEFAKLHVEAALKAALNNAEYADGNDSAVDDIDEESILNSYPLENIK